MFGYLRWALLVTVIGLALGAWLGWNMTGTVAGMLMVFFICAILAVLEISLSFDNSIVNAYKLRDMTPEERLINARRRDCIGVGRPERRRRGKSGPRG